MTKTTNYYTQAKNDARQMVEHFFDQIIEQLLEKGEASDDYNNDYPDGDSYHHENHVDQWYDLTEAAQLLDQLSEFEETDSGIWEGLDPREAIGAQAAYTYGNAVSSKWSDLIKAINNDTDVETALSLGMEEENEDGPALDPKGKDWDDALMAFDIEDVGPLCDFASENGYKWSPQLQAGYRYEFLCEARENFVRKAVTEVIK